MQAISDSGPKGQSVDNRVMIVGQSPEINGVLRLIEVFAVSTAAALVTGESGCGKELVAQALHRKSPRGKGAFIPVNCAAIPRDLLESELFGYRKGAFSGALADRMGRFELANGGTIFLDEIGDMSLEMQSKMLRVLQEGVVDPIGSSRQVRVDVRVIAATHRDLEADCATGRFREDLFYRLNVLPIAVPALRHRSEDVADLVAFFAAKHAVAGTTPVDFDAEFLALLKSYSWPGNVRELSNLINRLGIMYPGRCLRWWDVSPQMFPKKMREMLPAMPSPQQEATLEACAQVQATSNNVCEIFLARVTAELEVKPETRVTQPALFAVPRLPESTAAANPVEEIILIAHGKLEFPVEVVFLKESLAEMEKKVISRALDHTGGNISRTAVLLKLKRTTLIQKLNKLKGIGFDEDEFRALPRSVAA